MYTCVFQVVSFRQVFSPKSLYDPSSEFHTLHTTCSAHLIRLDWKSRIKFTEEYKAQSCSLSSLSITFFLVPLSDLNYMLWWSPTAQKTLSLMVIKTNQLMLYREIIAVCSEIHKKHINTLCGLNVEFVNVKNLVVHEVTTGI
jgi:hypothetical protein